MRFKDVQSENNHGSAEEQSDNEPREGSHQSSEKDKAEVEEIDRNMADTDGTLEIYNDQMIAEQMEQHNPPPTISSHLIQNRANSKYALRRRPKQKREAEFTYTS